MWHIRLPKFVVKNFIDMIRATTANGTPVWVDVVDDVEPNEGGFYCEIYLNVGGDRYDDFCIHPEDCDCKNDRQVIAKVRRYVETIEDY
jgi:hypothetical protein